MMDAVVFGSESGELAGTLIPERGCIVTSLRVDGKELLYLDQATLADRGRSVRGGIPVLFPFCGKVQDGIYQASGRQMPQHGFGRNHPWKTVGPKQGAMVYAFDGGEAVGEAFPFPFVLEHWVTMLPRGLQLALRVENRGERAFPVSPGWHPYFACPAGEKEQVVGNLPGTQAGSFHDRGEVNFGVPMPPDGLVRFKIPALGVIRVSAPSMKHLQLWTLPGKDFVCIEPFHGPPNAVNTEAAAVVYPGEELSFVMRIEQESALVD